MPIPLLAWLAMGAGQNLLGQLDANATRDQQNKMTDKELAASKAARDQSTALQESLANPFRGQASQIATASALDRTARGSYTPVHMTPPPGMEKYVPQMSGGYSYDKSPALTNAAAAAEKDVLAGHTAPTMTDPMNYGRTAALSLDENGNPTGPAAGGMAGNANARPLSALTESYGRRGQTPGLFGGAGLLQNAGRASTAKTDFAVNDARDAITRAISYYQGRAASPQEVEQILKSQGWKPGDRWVGEAGLNGVLSQIAAPPQPAGAR